MTTEETIWTRLLHVSGRVQGVGFRPFLYRLAHRHGLSGWVRNQAGVVAVLVQGPQSAVAGFVRELASEAPPLSRPRLRKMATAPRIYPNGFEILGSRSDTSDQVHIPPDHFACDDCLAEMVSPGDRRYCYPFINCTQCGPRYTIIDRLPYDRPNTAMSGFELCPPCQAEYENPLDRRFHAQPLACPQCGPKLRYHDHGQRQVYDDTANALAACIRSLEAGEIVAVKGIGGYHLMCDATRSDPVRRLRERKGRPHKPLAVMVPMAGDDGMAVVRQVAVPEAIHAQWLKDPLRPIVLVSKRKNAPLAAEIAPDLDEVGLMLPYSPLHHLLLSTLNRPLVATSANLSGEPVLTDDGDVESRLGHVARGFLHHDRPIRRPADDSVFRVIAGRPRLLRPGRGCAPLERSLPFSLSAPLLAVGGEMKNTIALAWGKRVVVSPHVGHMGSLRTQAVFEGVIADLQSLYGVKAEQVVCDAHPDYAASRWAHGCNLPVIHTFHHHAHASALVGEHGLREITLVFTWDGVGFGADGTLWGGEAFLGQPGRWWRVATFRPFYLPGGDKAGREPWRSALALCWEAGIPWAGAPPDLAMLRHAWEHKVHAPRSSAVGRLFDAAAALTGLISNASFEGQGPMALEAAAGMVTGTPCPPQKTSLLRNDAGLWISDWKPMIAPLLNQAIPVQQRAANFHVSMANTLLEKALAVRNAHGVNQVGLSGGVFQNRLLSEQGVRLLEAHDFKVFLHEAIPCNDAGLSFGQIVEAGASMQTEP